MFMGEGEEYHRYLVTQFNTCYIPKHLASFRAGFMILAPLLPEIYWKV
jgi:hypothetical protein